MREWESEPDEINENIHGYNIQIKRHKSLKHLCGYVLLKNTHSCYGKQYNNINVRVHGGLTYSEKDGEYWKIGFDCAHDGDLVPGFTDLGFSSFADGKYKNINYVKMELARLIEQLEMQTA